VRESSFGYAGVSTMKQDLDRQIDALEAAYLDRDRGGDQPH
jgi:DNA invertase Pin-like site-specific DNA recombinase